MLLQRLKDYAENHAGVAAFHRERVFAWQINLDSRGRLRSHDLQQLVNPDNTRRPVGMTHVVPAMVRTVGVAANLAADDVQYVLGWSDQTTRPDRVAECHAAFVDLIERWAASPEATGDPVAAAVATFYRSGDISAISQPEGYSAKDGVVISVDGTFAHQAVSVPAFWAREVIRRKGSDREGRCLVCGQVQPLLDTIPSKIPGRLIPGASNDAALVSVNAAVFGYDLIPQLVCTPICLGCGESTTAGLHALLSSPDSTTYSGQDSRMAWWITGGSDRAVCLLDDPDAGEITELLQSLNQAERPAASRLDAFCSLTVGGNIARVVVRDWIEMPLADVVENIGQWFDQHQIVSRWEGNRYHSVGRFALVTGRWLPKVGKYAPFGATGANRPPNIHRELMRAALRGQPIPMHVLVHLLNRIRTDGRVDDARAALLRLSLNRSPLTPAREKPMPDLDPANTDPAYVSGRLFAVYEQIQWDCHQPVRTGDEKTTPTRLNVTFGDRYFAGAIASPRAALMNGARDSTAWLRKLRRRSPGAAVNSEKRVDELYRLLDSDGIPARLTPTQQASFVVGYHHQRAHQFHSQTKPNRADEETTTP